MPTIWIVCATDPAFKLACGRLPDSGVDLCSQPTLSRLENGPSLRDAIRLTWALVDQWMASYDPGCVKTLQTIVGAQQKNQVGSRGESFMRQMLSD
jgi:hypothetical protein